MIVQDIINELEDRTLGLKNLIMLVFVATIKGRTGILVNGDLPKSMVSLQKTATSL